MWREPRPTSASLSEDGAESSAGRLTEGFREPKHLLVVDVCLVPDEIIRQVWCRSKPLPEEAALNRHHEVDLHEVEGDGRVGEADPQDRFVARGTAAQVAQPHLAARDSDFLPQSLERQITAVTAVRSRGGGVRGGAATAHGWRGVWEAERKQRGTRGKGEGRNRN